MGFYSAYISHARTAVSEREWGCAWSRSYLASATTANLVVVFMHLLNCTMGLRFRCLKQGRKYHRLLQKSAGMAGCSDIHTHSVAEQLLPGFADTGLGLTDISDFLKDIRNKGYCLITAHYTYFSKHVIQINLPSSQISPLVSDPLSMQTHISNAPHMEEISKPVGFAPGLRLKSSQFFFLHTLGLLKLFPNVFVSHMSNAFPQKLDMSVSGALWKAVSSPQRMTSAWVSGTQQQTD